MSTTTIRLGKKTFRDNTHFPRGIGRSGHFSISESYILEKYGDTLVQLSNGSLLPENEEEQRFSAVCQGKYHAQSMVEKLWLKYVEKTSPKRFHTLFGSRKTGNSGEDRDPETGSKPEISELIS